MDPKVQAPPVPPTPSFNSATTFSPPSTSVSGPLPPSSDLPRSASASDVNRRTSDGNPESSSQLGDAARTQSHPISPSYSRGDDESGKKKSPFDVRLERTSSSRKNSPKGVRRSVTPTSFSSPLAVPANTNTESSATSATDIVPSSDTASKASKDVFDEPAMFPTPSLPPPLPPKKGTYTHMLAQFEKEQAAELQQAPVKPVYSRGNKEPNTFMKKLKQVHHFFQKYEWYDWINALFAAKTAAACGFTLLIYTFASMSGTSSALLAAFSVSAPTIGSIMRSGMSRAAGTLFGAILGTFFGWLGVVTYMNSTVVGGEAVMYWSIVLSVFFLLYFLNVSESALARDWAGSLMTFASTFFSLSLDLFDKWEPATSQYDWAFFEPAVRKVGFLVIGIAIALAVHGLVLPQFSGRLLEKLQAENILRLRAAVVEIKMRLTTMDEEVVQHGASKDAGPAKGLGAGGDAPVAIFDTDDQRAIYEKALKGLWKVIDSCGFDTMQLVFDSTFEPMWIPIFSRQRFLSRNDWRKHDKVAKSMREAATYLKSILAMGQIENFEQIGYTGGNSEQWHSTSLKLMAALDCVGVSLDMVGTAVLDKSFLPIRNERYEAAHSHLEAINDTLANFKRQEESLNAHSRILLNLVSPAAGAPDSALSNNVLGLAGTVQLCGGINEIKGLLRATGEVMETRGKVFERYIKNVDEKRAKAEAKAAGKLNHGNV